MIHFMVKWCHNLHGRNLTITLFYIVLLKPPVHVVKTLTAYN